MLVTYLVFTLALQESQHLDSKVEMEDRKVFQKLKKQEFLVLIYGELRLVTETFCFGYYFVYQWRQRIILECSTSLGIGQSLIKTGKKTLKRSSLVVEYMKGKSIHPTLVLGHNFRSTWTVQCATNMGVVSFKGKQIFEALLLSNTRLFSLAVVS